LHEQLQFDRAIFARAKTVQRLNVQIIPVQLYQTTSLDLRVARPSALAPSSGILRMKGRGYQMTMPETLKNKCARATKDKNDESLR
jgi:hypothetical protein